MIHQWHLVLIFERSYRKLNFYDIENVLHLMKSHRFQKPNILTQNLQICPSCSSIRQFRKFFFYFYIVSCLQLSVQPEVMSSISNVINRFYVMKQQALVSSIKRRLEIFSKIRSGMNYMRARGFMPLFQLYILLGDLVQMHVDKE